MTLCSVSSADVESQSVRKVTLGGVPVLVGKLGQILLKFPYNTKILWFYLSKLKKKLYCYLIVKQYSCLK